jgi:TRAP-type C4-dicarboxylate transport system permease small subunit
MLRDLVDRFGYRYRLWSAESRSDNLGAGASPVSISPKAEPAWRLVLRFLQMLTCGLILLGALYQFAMRTFPSLSDGIPMVFIFLAVVWCGVGLFMMGGELLTKYSKSDDHDKGI